MAAPLSWSGFDCLGTALSFCVSMLKVRPVVLHILASTHSHLQALTFLHSNLIAYRVRLRYVGLTVISVPNISKI